MIFLMKPFYVLVHANNLGNLKSWSRIQTVLNEIDRIKSQECFVICPDNLWGILSVLPKGSETCELLVCGAFSGEPIYEAPYCVDTVCRILVGAYYNARIHEPGTLYV